MGCGLGKAQYVKSAQFIGVTAPAIAKTVKEVNNSCACCLHQRVLLNAKYPYSKHILKEHSPDHLVAATVSQDPLSHVVFDETGLIFFSDGESKTSDLYLSSYLLICVELVTYFTHLVITKDMSTRSVIQALEQYNNSGKFS